MAKPKGCRNKKSKVRTDDMFDWMVDYKKANNGNSPSRREIQRGMDLSSVSIVTYHLKMLQNDGRISIMDGGGIIIPGGRWSFNGEKNEL